MKTITNAAIITVTAMILVIFYAASVDQKNEIILAGEISETTDFQVQSQQWQIQLPGVEVVYDYMDSTLVVYTDTSETHFIQKHYVRYGRP